MVALAGAMLALAVLPTCAGAAVASHRAGSPEAAESAVSTDEQAFALELLRRLGPTATDLVLSPSSLDTLLAMVEPGAAGTTGAGIAKALHSEGLTAGAQAAGWKALEGALSAMTTKGRITLDTANEAWLQDGLSVRKAYLQQLVGDFGAGLEHGDLQGDPSAAAEAIDAWVASHTGGHVTHLLDARELQHAVAVLVDAVYMDAPWQEAFPAALTKPAPFHLAQGTVEVPMMSIGRPRQLEVLTSPGLEAAELPYAGGRLSALVIMPAAGQLGSFEADLTPSRLASLLGRLGTVPALVELPKFEAHSSLQLNSVLSAMGMGQAFSGTADFANLSPVPLELSFVVQDAQIEVAEKGTEASAASGAGIVPTAIAVPPGPRLVFDHPFLVLVRDDVTGTIVFEARVGNPMG
jgi:serine protease inhibitor